MNACIFMTLAGLTFSFAVQAGEGLANKTFSSSTVVINDDIVLDNRNNDFLAIYENGIKVQTEGPNTCTVSFLNCKNCEAVRTQTLILSPQEIKVQAFLYNGSIVERLAYRATSMLSRGKYFYFQCPIETTPARLKKAMGYLVDFKNLKTLEVLATVRF